MPQRYVSPALGSLMQATHTAPIEGIEAKIYDRIWRAVIEGKLRPGTKLREDVIGETFNISRTVIRKVLFILEQEGIVNLPANRGAYVATPTPDDARAALEALRMLASYVAQRLGSPERSLAQKEEKLIRQHIAIEAEAEEAGDFATARMLVGEFFIMLAAIHGNRLLSKQIAEIWGRVALSLAFYQMLPFQFERAKWQGAVLDLLLVHKGEEAAAVLLQWTQAVERTLRFDNDSDEVDLKAILGG